LDEDEYAIIVQLYTGYLKKVKEYREVHNCGVREALDHVAEPICEAYARLTGDSGVRQNEILKHRLKDFGPPCGRCGKTLRTSEASKCLECGQAKE
jgi:hypothetical protein